eukprot:scaffold112568_cov32-Tisochrysis_lutea.AAC.3
MLSLGSSRSASNLGGSAQTNCVESRGWVPRHANGPMAIWHERTAAALGVACIACAAPLDGAPRPAADRKLGGFLMMYPAYLFNTPCNVKLRATP